MRTFSEQAAPATAVEFKRAVTSGFRTANPGASLVFTSRVRRFPGRPDQPEGTVSFAVEFLAGVDGKTAEFIGTSFRLGGENGNHRVGAGHVEASPRGIRKVWA